MASSIELFEDIVRKAHRFTDESLTGSSSLHPFDVRQIHSSLPAIVRQLFDNGHYAQATFEAMKFTELVVKHFSGISDSGYKLMMSAFSENGGPIKLNSCGSGSQNDEQLGYKFMFAGMMSGIRNPRAHDVVYKDSIDQCLDHLSICTSLLRRMDLSGYDVSNVMV